MTTLIYCRSGKDIGMGHVVRCRHLADELRLRVDPVIVAAYPDEPGWSYLEKAGTRRVALGPEGLMRAIEIYRPSRVVDDRPGGRPAPGEMLFDDALLQRMRDKVRSLVVLVGAGWNITERTKALADLIVYQGVGQPSEALLAAPGAKILHGLEYVILGPEYRDIEELDRSGAAVYFGGGVGLDYVSAVLEAMKDIGGTVVLGPQHDGEHFESHGFGVSLAPPTMKRILERSRIFVGTMGMVAYEAIACRTFPVLVSRTEDHWRTADRLEEQGAAMNLGTIMGMLPRELGIRVRALLRGKALGPPIGFVDALGAQRVAEEILAP